MTPTTARRVIPITACKRPIRDATVGERFLTAASRVSVSALLATFAIVMPAPAAGQTPHGQAGGTLPTANRSLMDSSVNWPTGEQILRALTLRDYNTRIVVIGTTLLGIAAGVVGTFAYLRKRAMLGDALSHATLPGVALAFLLVGHKNLAALLVGAAVTGTLGVLAVIAIRRSSRLKEDTAIGIVLGVFFGFGMVLFSLIQQMKTGDAAGIQGYIYGSAAAMIERDARLIAACAALVILGALLFYKEFRLVCFDQPFAAAQGWPVLAIDLLMMALVIATTVVGLQAVGLILVVALLIIPAAAARFWTDRLGVMVWLAGLIGAVSGWLGSTFSALTPRLPTGAVIVITAGVLFFASMVISPHRGLLAAVFRRWRTSRWITYQNLFRALAESEETMGRGAPASFDEVRVKRNWSPRTLKKLVAGSVRRGFLDGDALPQLRLTAAGRVEATRILRNHRLWEMYLIKYADIAPSHVDRDADEVEHVLGPSVTAELEEALAAAGRVPPSPHPQEVGVP